MKASSLLLIGFATALALPLASARAASTLTWDTSNTAGFQNGTGTWDTSTANWATDGTGTTRGVWVDGSTAVFSLSASSYGAPTIGSGNISAAGLVFTGATGGNYTLAGTGALQIGSGGIVNALTSGSIETISAPVVLTASQTWSSTATRTLSNGAAMVFTGDLSTSSGTTNLTFDGRGLYSAETYANGNSSVGFALKGSSAGFHGSVTLTGGAALELDYNLSATAKLAPTSALILAGGLINFNSAPTGLVTESVASTFLSAGGNAISLGGSGGTLAGSLQLNTISRSAGATLDLYVNTKTPVYIANANTNGILGGWATANGDTAWVIANGTASAATTTGGSQFTGATWTAASNVRLNGTAAIAVAANSTLNSLNITGSGASLAIDPSATLTVASGGILGNVAGAAINGGSITSGYSTGELFVYTPFATTIGSSIVDNGGTKTILVKGGTNTLTLTGTNSYTGGTQINNGTLALASGASITGSVRVQGGATFDTSAAGGFTVASGKSLSGGGTALGAVTVANGGSLAPSYSYKDDQGLSHIATGTLKIGGTASAGVLTMNAGSALTFYIGTNSDQISILGTSGSAFSIGGPITLNLFDAGGVAAGSYTLMQWQANTTLSGLSDVSNFTVVTNDGITGTLSLGTNSLVFTVSSVAAVPEPGTWLLLACGLGFCALTLRTGFRAGKKPCPVQA